MKKAKKLSPNEESVLKWNEDNKDFLDDLLKKQNDIIPDLDKLFSSIESRPISGGTLLADDQTYNIGPAWEIEETNAIRATINFQCDYLSHVGNQHQIILFSRKRTIRALVAVTKIKVTGSPTCEYSCTCTMENLKYEQV